MTGPAYRERDQARRGETQGGSMRSTPGPVPEGFAHSIQTLAFFVQAERAEKMSGFFQSDEAEAS